MAVLLLAPDCLLLISALTFYPDYQHRPSLHPPFKQTVAGVAFCPIDIVKQRVQTQQVLAPGVHISPLAAVRQVYAAAGVPGEQPPLGGGGDGMLMCGGTKVCQLHSCTVQLGRRVSHDRAGGRKQGLYAGGTKRTRGGQLAERPSVAPPDPHTSTFTHPPTPPCLLQASSRAFLP